MEKCRNRAEVYFDALIIPRSVLPVGTPEEVCINYY